MLVNKAVLLVSSVLGAFVLLPFFASADAHAVGCQDQQVHCTAFLLGVALPPTGPTWEDVRIREWGRAKASMPPQEFVKWERHWRQEVERQRRHNNNKRETVWKLGICAVVVLVSLIVSKCKGKRCPDKRHFRVSSEAIIAACQKRKIARQNTLFFRRREPSRIQEKTSSANTLKNGYAACRRTGLFGCVCSWVWLLALAVLTGCISWFFHVAPNVPTVTDLVGLLILGLSLWTLVWPGTGERRGISQFEQSVVFLCVALIAAFAYAVWLVGECRARLEWPTGSGVIRAVERQGEYSGVDSKYEYAFRVDGREYAGEFSERMLLELSSDNHVRTIGKTRERNVGDAVTVFYDPQNPTDSYVRIPSHRGQSFWAGFLLVLVIVVLVFGMVRKKRNRMMYGWR